MLPTLTSPESECVPQALDGTGARDPELEDIAALAAQICDVPFAVLSLLGGPLHWFMAGPKLILPPSAQAYALCEDVRKNPGRMFVADEAGGPAGTGIQFAGGVPIAAIGRAPTGAVCVMDTESRTLSPAQSKALHILARHAATLANMRARAWRAASSARYGEVSSASLAHGQQQSDGTGDKLSSLAFQRKSALLSRTCALVKAGGWEIDPKTMTFNWSDEVFRIHDMEPGVPPPVQAATEQYEPEARPLLVAAVKASVENGKPWELELPLLTAKGRRVWVRTVGETVFENGRPVLIVGTIQDITERRLAGELLREERQRLRLVTDNMPASVTHLDLNERYTFANKFAGEFFAIDSEGMIGRTVREVRGDALYATLKPHIDRALQGVRVVFDNEAVARGKKVYTQSTFIPDMGADGKVQGIYAMTFDVTERKAAEIRSAESERRLRGLTDNVPALMTELDLDGRVVFCNGQWGTWLGIPPASMVGRHVREFIGDAHYELRKPVLQRAYAGEVVSFEQTHKFLIGERTVHTTYLPQKDAAGAVVGLYVLSHDISELKEKQKQLDALAREDALTGLPNRRFFEERVQEALSRSRRSLVPVCLMFLDIDHFKAINDSLGHAVGDAVLKEFGRRLQTCVRETDMAARYAGDEFVILLEGVANAEHGQLVAGKVLEAMHPAYNILGRALRVTTSIGIALSDGHDEDLHSLLASADAALYAAKKEGRNRFALAAPTR